MDLKQLEAFVQVINQGSFSKAAEKLFLTQPTVSAHISTLEKELNCQLVLRSSKEALPTKLGQELYSYAVQMLDLRSQAIAQIRGQQDRPGGIITLAASSIPYQYVLPKLMVDFRESYPDISFNVLSFDSAGVAEAVSLSRVQLGMAGTSLSDPQCSYTAFLNDDLVIAAPNLPLYDRLSEDSFSLAELQKLPFIVREPGSGTRKETERFLSVHGIDPDKLNIIAQMDNSDAIKRAISQGLGLSVLSRLAVEDFEQLGLLRTHHPAGTHIQRKLYLVKRKAAVLPPSALVFESFLCQYFDSGQDAAETH